MAASRCATRLQTPQPDQAIATATPPLTAEEAKTTFERVSNRNRRV